MQLASGGMGAVERLFDHARRLARYLVRANRDKPVGTERDQRQSRSVVAGKNAKVFGAARDYLHHLREVARRLFRRDDVLEFVRELQCRLSRNVRRGSTRYVVEHDRKAS